MVTWKPLVTPDLPKQANIRLVSEDEKKNTVLIKKISRCFVPVPHGFILHFKQALLRGRPSVNYVKMISGFYGARFFMLHKKISNTSMKLGYCLENCFLDTWTTVIWTAIVWITIVRGFRRIQYSTRIYLTA